MKSYDIKAHLFIKAPFTQNLFIDARVLLRCVRQIIKRYVNISDKDPIKRLVQTVLHYS